MTAGQLSIRVGDRTYGVQSTSRRALAYFRRAYAACLGPAGGNVACFTLERAEGDWQARSEGAVLSRGPLDETVRFLEWELTRRAVREDSCCAAFHAGWLTRGGQAVMLAGPGGAGKSRTCLQLLERGFLCGAEDVTFVLDDRLIPFPRAIQIRSDDTVLDRVAPSRRFPGRDGRTCVEIRTNEAARETGAGNMLVAFLGGAGSLRSMQPLRALEALKRLFDLCHQQDRVTPVLFETLAAAAAAGRMVLLPRQEPVDALVRMLGA
jgi:hypothetical protein